MSSSSSYKLSSFLFFLFLFSFVVCRTLKPRFPRIPKMPNPGFPKIPPGLPKMPNPGFPKIPPGLPKIPIKFFKTPLFKFNAVYGTSLFRYWNGKDHLYTTNSHEIGADRPGSRGKYGFVFEGYVGICLAKIARGSVPLLRYFNGKEHFYTTSPKEIGTTVLGKTGKYGYKYEGIEGYVYTKNTAFTRKNLRILGLAPLYRYFNGLDHFYTMNAKEIGTTKPGKLGKHGYKSEGIACWMWPY